MLFAAAAWKVKARDAFIGWSAQQRQERLSLIINNSRFLILPHVRVPHLASHILGTILRRLRSDWQRKYHIAPCLAETFVERERFSRCLLPGGQLAAGGPDLRSQPARSRPYGARAR